MESSDFTVLTHTISVALRSRQADLDSRVLGSSFECLEEARSARGPRRGGVFRAGFRAIRGSLGVIGALWGSLGVIRGTYGCFGGTLGRKALGL